ncbi:MAG TPA: SRPBCC family protein [Thermoplasmata archaeon]
MFTRTNMIDATPDRVFAVLTDLGRAQQWMPSIQKIDPLTSGPFVIGTSWRETRAAGKRTLESMVRVTALEPPTRLGLEVDSKPMKGHLEFRLTPRGGGTEIQYEAEMRGKGLFRLMSGAMNRMMAETDDDLLDRLKGQVERR